MPLVSLNGNWSVARNVWTACQSAYQEYSALQEGWFCNMKYFQNSLRDPTHAILIPFYIAVAQDPVAAPSCCLIPIAKPR